MQIEQMTIEDILGMAIVTEIHGHSFYLNLSEKIANAAVKSRIKGLADDELKHRQIIEELYRRLLGREPQELPTRGVPDILRAIASLKVDDRTQVLSVLDMAIEAETISAKFYQRGAAISTDNNTRRIFEELEAEEDGHFNYLVSEKGALTGDLYWFSINDSAMMEE